MAGLTAHKGIAGMCLSACLATGAHAAGGSTPGTGRRRSQRHRQAAYSANWRSRAGAMGQPMSGIAWMPA